MISATLRGFRRVFTWMMMSLAAVPGPALAQGQEREATCLGAACQLSTDGGSLIFYTLPDVFHGSMRLGSMAPSDDFAELFEPQPASRAAYDRFVTRYKWRRAAFAVLTGSFVAATIGVATGNDWSPVVGPIALVSIVGTYVAQHKARAQFEEAISAYNEASPGRPPP